MAMAVMAAISARADVTVVNPAYIAPDPDPSTWNSGVDLTIGTTAGQSASVTLDNGTTDNAITSVDLASTYLGGANTADGNLTVTGNGATWHTTSLLVGYRFGSTATLNIDNGGAVSATYFYIGRSAGSASFSTTGTVTLTNGSTASGFDVELGGAAASTGILNILSGSTFTSTGPTELAQESVGSSGIVNVNNATWNAGGTIYIGYTTGGTGELNISNGGVVNMGTNALNDGDLYGHGTLSITTGGTLITGGTSQLGGSINTTYGIVTIDGDGSSWTATNGYIDVTRGVMTISNGGLVTANAILASSGGAVTTALFFNGGIFKPTSTAQPSCIGGAFDSLILTDTPTRPALTMQVDIASASLAEVFTGTGGITKTGTGTLTFNGAETYTGLTDVAAGKLMGETSFAGSLTVRDGAIYAPGGPNNVGPAFGAWTAHIGGGYTQESGASLLMDIGSLGSDMLVVNGDVSLDGDLFLHTNGTRNADFYVLIDNLGSDPVSGDFANIFLDGNLLTLTPMAGMNGGGSFLLNGTTYYFSYAGLASTGGALGGNDVILTTIIPEPASLSILALGAATLFTRRRK